METDALLARVQPYIALLSDADKFKRRRGLAALSAALTDVAEVG
jgi:hypothetical protein